MCVHVCMCVSFVCVCVKSFLYAWLSFVVTFLLLTISDVTNPQSLVELTVKLRTESKEKYPISFRHYSLSLTLCLSHTLFHTPFLSPSLSLSHSLSPSLSLQDRLRQASRTHLERHRPCGQTLAQCVHQDDGDDGDVRQKIPTPPGGEEGERRVQLCVDQWAGEEAGGAGGDGGSLE